MDAKITVLLVDDHKLFRRGVRLFLESCPDIQLVGEVSSGEEAIRFLAGQFADVVLLDVEMPGMDGAETAKEISIRWPGIRILMFSSRGSKQKLAKALESGAAGFVMKDAPPEELVATIRKVAAAN
ncbi:MAG: response regulator transcription factor [Firmicutes bacterium]|nr:response regulator transcription factor [Bacillota bacterium]